MSKNKKKMSSSNAIDELESVPLIDEDHIDKCGSKDPKRNELVFFQLKTTLFSRTKTDCLSLVGHGLVGSMALGCKHCSNSGGSC